MARRTSTKKTARITGNGKTSEIKTVKPERFGHVREKYLHGPIAVKNNSTPIETIKPPSKEARQKIESLSETIPDAGKIFQEVKAGTIENHQNFAHQRAGIKPDKVLTKFTQEEWNGLRLGSTLKEKGKTYICACTLSVIDPKTKSRYPVAYFLDIEKLKPPQ